MGRAVARFKLWHRDWDHNAGIPRTCRLRRSPVAASGADWRTAQPTISATQPSKIRRFKDLTLGSPTFQESLSNVIRPLWPHSKLSATLMTVPGKDCRLLWVRETDSWLVELVLTNPDDNPSPTSRCERRTSSEDRRRPAAARLRQPSEPK